MPLWTPRVLPCVARGEFAQKFVGAVQKIFGDESDFNRRLSQRGHSVGLRLDFNQQAGNFKARHICSRPNRFGLRQDAQGEVFNVGGRAEEFAGGLTVQSKFKTFLDRD